MKIKRKYTTIYNDAIDRSLRPKTGLKDMILELDPGTRRRASEGRRHRPGLPDAARHQRRRDPRPLDGDTRDYLRLLLAGAGQGLKDNGSGPARPRSGASSRRPRRRSDHEAAGGAPANIAASIHNFSLLTEELATKDDELARWVDSVERRVRALRRPGREPPRIAPASCRRRSRRRRPRWARPTGWPGRSARRSRRCARPRAPSARR